MSLPSSESKNEARKLQRECGSSQSSACYLLHAGFLLGVSLEPEECRLIFNGLHGVISQKTEPFVNTAVRTANHMKQAVENFVN
jgi:hypothetical protein